MCECLRPRQGFGGQHGYYTDPETGLSLLTHRYYDAGAGRFVTRDPIGYRGGINLYGFAGNNPVNRMDPEGTDDLADGLQAYGVQLAISVLRQHSDPLLQSYNRWTARNQRWIHNHAPALEAAGNFMNWGAENVPIEGGGPALGTLRGASRASVTLERYGSEAEAAAAENSGRLLPRPGHSSSTNEKWVGEVGTVNPRTLGGRPKVTHSHRMKIKADATVLEWLKENATIKPNEPGRYGIPNSKLDDFNNHVRSIKSEKW